MSYITLEPGGSRPPTDTEAAHIRVALGMGGVLGDKDFVSYTDADSPLTLAEVGKVVFLDATGGDIDVYLPALDDEEQQHALFKRIDESGNTVTIYPAVADAGAEIEGEASATLGALESVTLRGDTATWWNTGGDAMTGAEIKAAYEAEADTNAFTDVEKSKLADLESSKFLGTYVNLGALQTAHASPDEGSYAHVDAGPGGEVEVYIWDDDSGSYYLQASASSIVSATESVKGIVELATEAEVDAASNVDAVVRAKHLSIRKEGGGVVLSGGSNPTSGGANSGDSSLIAGEDNYSNSGSHTSISGYENYENSGTHCSISGYSNHSNDGHYCLISGYNNHSNTGDRCSISGYSNHSNTGDYCSISGGSNHSNDGDYCSISGVYNHSNEGHNCSISGVYNNSNSGDYCSISGYGNNSNTGDYCSISGAGNHSNSGNYCLISGYINNSNSGDYCLISGTYNSGNEGRNCSISGAGNHSNAGQSCLISGYSASSNTLDYARVHGGGTKARIIDLVATAATTNATPRILTLGGAVESASNRIAIPVDTAWLFTVRIIAKDSTSAKVMTWSREGMIMNDGGTVSLDGLVGIGADRDVGALGASMAITADNTNDCLDITVTGVAATSIDWTARMEITQVG